MELNFLKAILGLVIGLVCLIVVLPIAGQLTPTIKDNSGASTALMVSAMILVLVIAVIYNVLNTAQPDASNIAGNSRRF